MLKINNLVKNYGRICALNSISLQINAGEVFGILGPNGSGKTTLLSIILDVIKPTSGSYTWNNGKKFSRGALIEQPNFYPFMTLYQNLKISAMIKGIDNIDNEIFKALKNADLYEFRYAHFSQLSLGMKQRLAIASAMLGNPDVVILDEPTNGLDPSGIVLVRNIIKNYVNDGKTIIIASHMLSEVEKICTDIAIMKNGNIITNGKIKDLLDTSTILKISVNQDITLLYNILNDNRQLIKKLDIFGNEISMRLVQGIEPSQISQLLFNNGFTVNKFEVTKQTLEDVFLNLVNSNHESQQIV